MSIFSDLQQNYKNWSDAHWRYRVDSARFMQQLCNDLTTYIGAPSSYIDRDRSNRRYVYPVKVTKEENGEFSFPEFNHQFDVIDHEEDGRWISGIHVTMDSATNAFPKSGYVFVVYFSLDGKQCNLSIHDKSFRFDTSDGEEAKLLYNYIVSTMQKAFDRKPWETVEKQRMGFTPPPPPSQT